MMLDIPADFDEHLRDPQRPAAVQLLVDTSKANVGYLASSYALRITEAFGREWAAAGHAGSASWGGLPRIENERWGRSHRERIRTQHHQHVSQDVHHDEVFAGVGIER